MMRMQAAIFLFIVFTSLYVKSKGLVRVVEKCGEEWGSSIPRDILPAWPVITSSIKITNSKNHSHQVPRPCSHTYKTTLVYRHLQKCRYGLVGSTIIVEKRIITKMQNIIMLLVDDKISTKLYDLPWSQPAGTYVRTHCSERFYACLAGPVRVNLDVFCAFAS